MKTDTSNFDVLLQVWGDHHKRVASSSAANSLPISCRSASLQGRPTSFRVDGLEAWPPKAHFSLSWAVFTPGRVIGMFPDKRTGSALAT